MTRVVISSAARTAVGSFGRSLRDVPPSELGATAARAAIERAELDPAQLEQVVFGNVIHTSARGPLSGARRGDQRRDSEGIACADGQPLVWQRPAGDRLGCPDDPDRRRGGGARRRCRVDEQGRLLDGERALGRAAGRGVARGLGRRRAHGPVRQDAHGSHGREPGRSPTAYPARRRTNSRSSRIVAQSRRSRRAGSRRRSCPIEVKQRKGAVEFKVDEHARPDVSARGFGEAQAGVRRGRHGDGRQRLRDQRRCGGRGGHVSRTGRAIGRACQGAGSFPTPSAEWSPRPWASAPFPQCARRSSEQARRSTRSTSSSSTRRSRRRRWRS